MCIISYPISNSVHLTSSILQHLAQPCPWGELLCMHRSSRSSCARPLIWIRPINFEYNRSERALLPLLPRVIRVVGTLLLFLCLPLSYSSSLRRQIMPFFPTSRKFGGKQCLSYNKAQIIRACLSQSMSLSH